MPKHETTPEPSAEPELTAEQQADLEADQEATQVAQLQEQTEADKALNAHLQGRVVLLRKGYNQKVKEVEELTKKLTDLTRAQPTDRRGPTSKRAAAKKAPAKKVADKPAGNPSA